jgi:superfamily II DNA or RNA helicase
MERRHLINGNNPGAPARLASEIIPQADRPELVLRVLAFVAREDRKPTPAEVNLPYEDRYVDYCCQAATLLKFLDSTLRITETGARLLTLEDDLQLLRLVCAFEESVAGQAWLRWANVKELNDLNPDTAAAFLQECAEFAEATASRRANTLRTWVTKFQALRHRGAGGQQLELRVRPPLLPLAPAAPISPAVLEPATSGQILHELAPGTHRVRVISAFFTISGYKILTERLEEAEIYLLIGQDERNPFAVRSVSAAATVLREFRESLDRGLPSTTRRKEIRKFHEDVLRSIVGVRYFEPRKHMKLHAKAYIYDRRAAYITSANLTINGLKQNVEVGALMTAPVDVEYYLHRFEELFREATPITLPILKEIESSWAFARPIAPYLFFLKIMFELNERLPELKSLARYELAEFQQRVVWPVITKLLNYRGVMLISPTGTGKTVMASYVAAYLAQERHVHRIIVICPNQSIGMNWKKTMAAFGRSVEILTHGLLRQPDTITPDNKQILDEFADNPRETDLFLIDECHHYRNEGGTGRATLQRLLPRDGKTRPYCLLLTATPISTGLLNLNMLLQLIGQPPIAAIEHVDRVPAVVNVTLPFIMAQHGVRQKGTLGRALRFGENYRYFPNLRIQTVRYVSPMAAAFEIIGNLPLKFEDGEDAAVQLVSEADDSPETPPGRTNGLLRIILARRAESSPLALCRSVERLLSNIEERRIHPVDRDDLCTQLRKLMDCVCAPKDDSKLQQLFKKIPAKGKVLIFSSSVDTVKYVAEQLGRRFRKKTVESLHGSVSLTVRREVLARFAPIARDTAKSIGGREIDILVTSDSCAEGEDMQDATTVINYDLSWTPLTLAQRIGRIDRATEHPRDVQVFNFYPGTERFEEIVRLWDRLEDRSKEFSALTRVQVLGEHQRSFDESTSDDLGPVRALYETGDYDKFVRALNPMPRYMEVWFGATLEEQKLARSLPDGVQSGEIGRESGCYVLLRHGDVIYSFFLGRTSQHLVRAPQDVTHEALVDDYVFATRTSTGIALPDDFDDEVAVAVQRWADVTGVDIEEVAVVAAKCLVTA